MKMDDEQYVIACIRIQMGEAPNTHSTVKNCGECMYPIWVADSTPVIEGARYLCLQCIKWEEVTDIAAPANNQMSDVLRSIK